MLGPLGNGIVSLCDYIILLYFFRVMIFASCVWMEALSFFSLFFFYWHHVLVTFLRTRTLLLFFIYFCSHCCSYLLYFYLTTILCIWSTEKNFLRGSHRPLWKEWQPLTQNCCNEWYYFYIFYSWYYFPTKKILTQCHLLEANFVGLFLPLHIYLLQGSPLSSQPISIAKIP